MNYRKILVAGFLAVFGFMFNFSAPDTKAQTAGLTESQIQAVLGLLRTFNADTSVISSVESALRGTPPREGARSLVPRF